MKKSVLIAAFVLFTSVSCQNSPKVDTQSQSQSPKLDTPDSVLLFPGEEKHLSNVKQLTFGGQNAEAYFSADGRWIIFQSKRGEHPCDEIYAMKSDGSSLQKVSTGKGATTCAYFAGLNPIRDQPSTAIFASTHDFGDGCPERPSQTQGYVWGIFPSYEIYARAFSSDGNGKVKRLTNNKAYDAEATVSPDQKQMVFTSTRDGDLDLYVMDVDGGNVRRVTRDLGYDGGAFFSHDGKKLIYRAFHPKTKEEKKEYTDNLKNNAYRPSWLELFIIDVDGKNKKQITHLGGASFAPFLFPKNDRVIFASNYKDPTSRKFDIYAVDLDGKNLEQITFSGTFDSFPMFSPDGRKIVWASNRNGKEPHETNVFIADWRE